MQLVVERYEQAPQYEANQRKAKGTEPHCIICGKNVKPETAVTVEIIDYGVTILLEGEEPGEWEGGSSIGCFMVGADCYKKVRKAAVER